MTAPPYYSSPEVTRIPVKTCPETFTDQEPVVPELCPWLLSFDVIALATVEARTSPSAYAVETAAARRIVTAASHPSLWPPGHHRTRGSVALTPPGS
jgi:hypothetical protein